MCILRFENHCSRAYLLFWLYVASCSHNFNLDRLLHLHIMLLSTTGPLSSSSVLKAFLSPLSLVSVYLLFLQVSLRKLTMTDSS